MNQTNIQRFMIYAWHARWRCVKSWGQWDPKDQDKPIFIDEDEEKRAKRIDDE
jgi:hypothetical protein